MGLCMAVTQIYINRNKNATVVYMNICKNLVNIASTSDFATEQPRSASRRSSLISTVALPAQALVGVLNRRLWLGRCGICPCWRLLRFGFMSRLDRTGRVGVPIVLFIKIAVQRIPKFVETCRNLSKVQFVSVQNKSPRKLEGKIWGIPENWEWLSFNQITRKESRHQTT